MHWLNNIDFIRYRIGTECTVITNISTALLTLKAPKFLSADIYVFQMI
jgi:hypothetical protein